MDGVEEMALPTVSTSAGRECCLDDATLRAQLEAHHADSYGWALSCCRHRLDEAENVLQIVYLKVLEHRAIFDGRSSFKTWLFSVIRRTAAGEYRTAILRRMLLQRFSTEPSSTREERNEDHEMLRKALQKLPARQREVLHLVFYQDLSIEEAAEIMGVGIGSARTHYDRAKKQLRKYLETR